MNFPRKFKKQNKVQRHLDVSKDFTTHRKFIVDLLQHVFMRYNVNIGVKYEHNATNCNVKRFNSVIGDAVLEYHYRNAPKLMEDVCVNLLPIDGSYISEKAALDCIYRVAYNTFTGVNFVKEFFHYCSFLVELAFYCIDINQRERVKTIVEAVAGVYELYWKRRFQVFGGWYVLHRYAVQYLTYQIPPNDRSTIDHISSFCNKDESFD